MVFFLRLPDEVFSLPPPPLLNHGSVWGAFMGWVAALGDNAVNRRPALRSGVHRQLLWLSAGFYLGHYLVRRANYTYAKRDRDISEYIRHHPEDFKEKDKKTMAEVLEGFQPIR
ncbi:NADH dehydrogenase [ubiquinone] 1 subunit C2 [Anolis sagrei]|uniref:NADH dehydrogenase [ubiquinone] 1 subunit C2 n=1 Tax=Anolis sagrei TaxID=38937 RepID=UPI0035214613